MKFCELTETEFTKFEEKSFYGNFFQSVPRAKLRERMGFKSFLVGVKDGDSVLAAGLAIEKFGEVWVQIGPVLDWDNIELVRAFVSGIVDFCKEKGFSEIEIFPPVLLSIREPNGEKKFDFDRKEIFKVFNDYGFSHLGFSVGTEYKANRWMAVKNLREMKDLDDIYESVTSTTRRYMRKTSRELEVRLLKDKSEIPAWRAALESSNLRNGIKTRELKYFEDVWDTFGDKVLFVAAVIKGTDTIVAGDLCFVHPNEIVSFLAGMVEEYKKLNGPTAINGWLMEECLRRGIPRFNFYGVEGDFSPENHLLDFKAGFGIDIEEYIGGFKKVLNPTKFKIGRLKRKVKTLFS